MISSLIFVGKIGDMPTRHVPDLQCGGLGAKGKFCTMRKGDDLVVIIGPPVPHDEWDEDYYHKDIMPDEAHADPGFVRSGGGYYCVSRSCGRWKIRFYGESGGYGKFCPTLVTDAARRQLQEALHLLVEVN